MHAEIIDTAGDGPPLVYVPGIDGSGELLLGTRERLQRVFRLTRLRYAGEPVADYPGLAASVVGAMDHEGIARGLVLAESFGVAVALETALDHRDRVAGLALVNGFARYSNRLGLALTRSAFALAPEAWIRAGRVRFAQRGLFAPRRDDAALEALLALRCDWFDERYRARLACIATVDLRPRLHEIRCPVGIWAADHDRVVAAVPAGREMASAIAGAELHVLEQAGHVVLPLAAEPWPERLQRLAARCGSMR
jgi:pimeloyl-ACP methyl ester carboxylesterase